MRNVGILSEKYWQKWKYVSSTNIIKMKVVEHKKLEEVLTI
jgi:hypothetical protein